MSISAKRQKLDSARPHTRTVVDNVDADELNHTKKPSHTAKTNMAPSQSKDPRTLFVRQLAPSVTNDDLALLFSQSYPIKHAVAVLDPATKACKGYGFVTFTEAADAIRAIAELNGTELRGRKVLVEQASVRSRGDDDEGVKKTSQKPQKPAPPKLIVRNLPWSVNSPEKLRKLFLSYGKVMDAILPKDAQGKMLGFGIVMIRGRPNNVKALESMNGKEVDGRTIAVDWAADRDTWEKVKKQELAKEKSTENGSKKKNKTSAKTLSDVDVAGQVEDDLDDTVDQILADKLQEHLDDDDDSASGDPIDSDESDTTDAEDTDQDEDDEKDDEIDDEDVVDTAVTRKSSTNNDATIFVRNLPFSCVDDDLAEHFEQFGSIRYSRVVFDSQTEQSKGSGFVCFVNKEDADACVREAPKTSTGSDFAHPRTKGGFGQTILQDETTDPTGRYTMDGRIVIVSKAVNKDEATKLREDGVERRNVRDKDKRKLYLLNEGKITPKSSLFQKLAPSDIAMRDASAKQRKKLIESNPSLHLSLTRLSIRNIPRSLESKDLKALARQAVVGFASDVKAGQRERLSKEELAREADGMKEAERIRKIRGKGIVRQAKVVFENEKGTKVQEVDGAGRSRGYGFVEYYTHRNALMGLRWLNGHQISYQAISKKKGDKITAEDRNRRLIVEFALENVNVINRRKEREHKTFNRRKGDAIESRDPSDQKNTPDERGPKSKRADKRKRLSGEGSATAVSSESQAAETSKSKDDEKLAKRTRIIVKKRMARRARKGAS